MAAAEMPKDMNGFSLDVNFGVCNAIGKVQLWILSLVGRLLWGRV